VRGISKFITTADSEASDAESPRFEDVAGVKASTDAPDRVGMDPMDEVEVEEEEEEDPDVHFKRKRKGERRRKWVVKKPHHYIPTAIAESESAAVPPPPAPLVIKLSAQKQTTEKAIPGLGKTTSILQHTYIHIQMYICIPPFFIVPLLHAANLFNL